MEQTTTTPQTTENSQNPLHEVTREERIALYKEVLSKLRDLSEPMYKLCRDDRTGFYYAETMLNDLKDLKTMAQGAITEALGLEIDTLLEDEALYMIEQRKSQN